MAVMSETQRQACWADLMATWPPGIPIPIDKNALRRCVDANDTVINTHAPSMNQDTQALESTWNQLNQAAKAQVHTKVIQHRYQQGVV